MLPEGCNIPLEGVLFYFLAAFVMIIVYRRRDKILEGHSALYEKIRVALETLQDLT